MNDQYTPYADERFRQYCEARDELRGVSAEMLAEQGAAGKLFLWAGVWIGIAFILKAIWAPLALLAIFFVLIYLIGWGAYAVRNFQRPWRRMKAQWIINRLDTPELRKRYYRYLNEKEG